MTNWKCLLGHQWVQYDKYYNSSRGIDAVILCDECSRCGQRSKLVGGGGLLFPTRLYEDKPATLADAARAGEE